MRMWWDRPCSRADNRSGKTQADWNYSVLADRTGRVACNDHPIQKRLCGIALREIGSEGPRDARRFRLQFFAELNDLRIRIAARRIRHDERTYAIRMRGGKTKHGGAAHRLPHERGLLN